VNYLSVALAVMSSSVMADPFTYVEAAHANYDSDFGMKFGAKALSGSVALDKNIGLFFRYERTDDIDYADTAEMLAEGFDIDATLTRVDDTARIRFLDPARTTLTIPADDTYTASDTLFGLRAFNSIAQNAVAYIDIGYHRQSIYDGTGNGASAKLGLRFSPIPKAAAFQLGGYGEYTMTEVGSFGFDISADDLTLDLTKRSIGIEAVVNINAFTLGAHIERSQLIHEFSVKFDTYGSFDEKFTDAYSNNRLFVQYHFN